MSENSETQSNLSEEFRNLGRSMKNFLESAWSSEERQKLQQELEKGINEIASSITEAAEEFTQSETGRQLKQDWKDLEDRVESGELQNKIRTDLKTALQKASEELERAAENFSSGQDGPGSLE